MKTDTDNSQSQAIALKDVIARYQISITSERVSHNPNHSDASKEDKAWSDSAFHWLCKFTRPDVIELPDGSFGIATSQKYEMKTFYSMGSAHVTNPPDVADVLDCLLSDASGVSNGESFDDWASEYGYDTDSRSAERIFLTVLKQTSKLRKFLGPAYVVAIAAERL